MTVEAATRVPDAPTMPLGLRIVVGVDGSVESLEAVRQAERLAEPHAAITLLGAWESTNKRSVAESRKLATHAVSRAQSELVEKMVRTRVAWGAAADLLCEEANAHSATLIAVGASRLGRLRGIVAGSTVTQLAHTSPCPLLVARAADERFPRRIVVGVDGSPESLAAFTVASVLAERFGAQLRPIVATGGTTPVDRELVQAIAGCDYVALRDEPVHALVSESTDADLLVLGSRCLSGMKALGSVSERVVHEAQSSVLVVRLPSR